MKLPAHTGITASAARVHVTRSYNPAYSTVQEEMWDLFERVDEFASAVFWKSNLLSGVRLVAAELIPGDSSPRILEEGPAAEAVAGFAGGLTGQSKVLGEMSLHLMVAGEGWLTRVPSTTGDAGDTDWVVLSAEEIRSRKGVIERRTGPRLSDWVGIGVDPDVIRFWRPHPRRGWLAHPRSAHARGALSELDLLNKRVIAETASRMASNGLLLYDKARLSLADTADPDEVDYSFAELLTEVGSRGIKDPMSSAATIKIPIGIDRGDDSVPLTDYLTPLDLSNPISDRLGEYREAAVERVGSVLEVVREHTTGSDGLSHWALAIVEESGVRTYVVPDVELLVSVITEGYLHPLLTDAGESLTGPSGGRVMVWYDPTPIVHHPDRASSAREGYDRMEISGEAYVRALGFSADDRPSAKELERMTDLLIRRGMAAPVLEVAAEEQEETEPEQGTPVTPDTEPTGDIPGIDDAPPAPGA